MARLSRTLGRPLVLAVLCWGALTAAAQECDFALAGPFNVVQQTVNVAGTSGANLSTDVFFPGTGSEIAQGAVPCPVIVLGHGFSGSKSQHVNTGRHLATRGYIVLVPNFNGGSDHVRNGEDLRRCLDWISARAADNNSTFFGRIALDRFAASGYSAGGLSAILAAAQDPRIRVLSLMDPVDSGGQGVAALANIAVPVAITFSEPSACNANASAETLFAAAGGLKRGMKIVGANHTDPQDPANPFAGFLCGSANPVRQMLYRRYLTGWFEFFLRDKKSCIGSVFNYPEGLLATDVSGGRITCVAPQTPLSLSGSWLSGMFAVAVSGPVGQNFIVERSVDGRSWSGVSTNRLGPEAMLWLQAIAEPSAVFRARSMP